MKTIKRKIGGIPVRFYKRSASSSFTMDFRLPGVGRVQEATKWLTLPEAEQVAAGKIEELKRLVLGGASVVRGSYATVGDVLAMARDGDKVMSHLTLRVYCSSLVRLARVLDEDRPEDVGMDKLMTRATVERFYSIGQGRGGRGVNWVDALPCNTGLNTCVRNVLALLSHRDKILSGLKLPDLGAVQAVDTLREPAHGFIPWPAGVFEAMVSAAEAIRESEPELWLVNLCLRKLGLRVEELERARRDWLEQDAASRWMIVLKNREGEFPFRLLKHGKPRKILLGPELETVLVARTGWLIGPDMGPTARHDLICREHSGFLRRFIPDRTKSNHELRMHAASVIYTRQGLGAASYFLGDSASTTERYYASWMGGAVGVDEAVGAA